MLDFFDSGARQLSELEPQHDFGGKMRRRSRKFIGAALAVGFAPVYALMAMALSQAGAVQDAPGLVRGLVLAALGLAWILPLMPLIKWMEKPDP
jgi:hypothetical protein